LLHKNCSAEVIRFAVVPTLGPAYGAVGGADGVDGDRLGYPNQSPQVKRCWLARPKALLQGKKEQVWLQVGSEKDWAWPPAELAKVRT
jgi:hypothetical protein